MKTTKEMIEVMQAYERGEKIEAFYNDVWVDIDMPEWSWGIQDYRVKRKKKYVPFDTADEFLSAQMEHGEVIVDIISGKKTNAYVNKNGTIVCVKKLGSVCTFGCFCTIFRYYKFEDGTPCGKEIEL